jgi:replication-associated recombination protein RarA
VTGYISVVCAWVIAMLLTGCLCSDLPVVIAGAQCVCGLGTSGCAVLLAAACMYLAISISWTVATHAWQVLAQLEFIRRNLVHSSLSF